MLATVGFLKTCLWAFFLALFIILHSSLNHGVFGICSFVEEEGMAFCAFSRIMLVKDFAGSSFCSTLTSSSSLSIRVEKSSQFALL